MVMVVMVVIAVIIIVLFLFALSSLRIGSVFEDDGLKEICWLWVVSAGFWFSLLRGSGFRGTAATSTFETRLEAPV